MSIKLFKDANTIIQPILGVLTLINTFFLTKSFIENSFSKKDSFFVKMNDKEILFMNRGKYPIKINEISIQYIEEEGFTGFVIENLLDGKSKKINGHEKSIIGVNFFVLNNIKIELEKIDKIPYLCFRISSESGRNYDSICCRLLDKNKKLIKTTRRLKKEIFFIKQ